MPKTPGLSDLSPDRCNAEPAGSRFSGSGAEWPRCSGVLPRSRHPCRHADTAIRPRISSRCDPDGPTPLTVGAMHVPNRVTGRKDLFFADVLRMLRGWRRGPTLLLGDTNSGLPDVDEEAPAFGPREVAWIHALERLGWSDAFRLIHGARRAYTWYSPNGRNGFRIDHAFVNRALRPSVHDVRYDWGAGIQGALSDHAALLLELDGSLRADFRGIRPGLPAGRALP